MASGATQSNKHTLLPRLRSPVLLLEVALLGIVYSQKLRKYAYTHVDDNSTWSSPPRSEQHKLGIIAEINLRASFFTREIVAYGWWNYSCVSNLELKKQCVRTNRMNEENREAGHSDYCHYITGFWEFTSLKH